MISLRFNPRSGVVPYLQIVHQVRQALQLELLRPGDQLPTVKEAVSAMTVNPNTVLKAYRALEQEGLVEGRPGLGTFVVRGIKGPSAQDQATLRRSLDRWMRSAFAAGLDADSVVALFEMSLRAAQEAGAA